MTLLAHNHRHAAHGLHLCGYCGTHINRGELYLDQRIADNGTCWTWRAHLDCHGRYWRAHYAAGLHEDELMEWSEVLAYERDLPQAQETDR